MSGGSPLNSAGRDSATARVRQSTSRVRVRKTADVLASELRGRIVRGELNEGDTLPPEAELVREFGVSRPTLREALRMLESEGLLNVVPGGRGAHVTIPDIGLVGRYMGLLLRLSGATLDDLFRARGMLESALVKALAGDPDRAAIADELRKQIAEERLALGNEQRFTSAANAFHRRLYDLAGNKTVNILAGSIWHLVETHMAAAAELTGWSPQANARDEAAVANHERLATLIEQGDREEAERFWAGYTETVRRLMVKAYGGDTPLRLPD